MIISHSKQFVLFAPWKAASQTMRKRLAQYSEEQYDRFFYFNSALNRVTHQHLTCADFCALPESKLNYFTAAFTRNPYDRAYSGFMQLQSDITYQPRQGGIPKWIHRLVAEQLSEIYRQLSAAAFDFDRWVDSLREEQVYNTGRNSNFMLHPAHYWTHIGEAQFVQYIGRVESFEDDFDRLCNCLALDDVPRINANVRGIHDGSHPYRYVDRMSSKSIHKINLLFEKDFDLFGYDRL